MTLDIDVSPLRDEITIVDIKRPGGGDNSFTSIRKERKGELFEAVDACLKFEIAMIDFNRAYVYVPALFYK